MPTQKIYSTDKFALIVLICLVAIGLGTAILSHTGQQNISTIVFLIIIFGIVILDFMYGIRGKLDYRSQELSRTDFFFLKKILKLTEIKEITYKPTWKLGEANRSLRVIGIHNGQQQVIDFPNLGFSQKTIALIARDLKSAVPGVRVDNYVEELINKYPDGIF